jgi:sigma-B regulation protein RsbU (phosphoserine phosphatase)
MVGGAAHSAGISNPRMLGPALQQVMSSASDRILWMRVLDLKMNVFAHSGNPEGSAKLPLRWWARAQEHESLGRVIDTTQGKALLVILPLRLAHPPPHGAGPPEDRRTAYVLEIAISLKAVASAFEGLRHNLIVGLLAAIALLVSLAVIGLRSPQYFRGKYLETELQLARRVQSDLRPKSQALSPHLQFAASAISADHVGGDFYDIFEAESGEIAIVLGDVSGKGIPAALLVSVIHGAIRSSTTSQHELACERINRMLFERTACERFATLFWGVFDPVTRTLRYVNAGHAAPMLVREAGNSLIRLDEGGPLLGVLLSARYSAGTVKIEHGDTLVLYSDGITEAADQHESEFGEDRIQELVLSAGNASPAGLCDRILNQVTAFASADMPADDRTLLVVKFAAGGLLAESRQAAELCAAVA